MSKLIPYAPKGTLKDLVNSIVYLEGLGTVYIQVDDIAMHLEKIVAAGGQKLIGPVTLPDGKQFAWFKDIAGNSLGLVTAK